MTDTAISWVRRHGLNVRICPSIEAVATVEEVGRGNGGINADWGFHWYGGA